MPVLYACSRSLDLEVGEDVRDAQALLDDHVVDSCAYYAEIPCHAVRGEAAQEVVHKAVPKVVRLESKALISLHFFEIGG